MKNIIVSVIFAFFLVLLAIVLTSGPKNDTLPSGSNVYMEGEKQVVDISAKGGYSPRKSVAKAGVPTIVRFNTKSTFDCSLSVRIPSMNISKILPQTGKTDIDIGTQEKGFFRGSCGMGMYPFEISFE